MATPRQIVRDHVLTKLKAITVANGYQTNVKTVELRSRLSREVGSSECPAIILTKGREREGSEQQTRNDEFRAWSMNLLLILTDPGSAELEDAGEVFLADVIKCLRTKTTRNANNSKPFDISYEIQSHEFERMENQTAQFSLDLTVKYEFMVTSL